MISKIVLENWRSHKKTELEFGKGTNVIVGVMGAGKTSVTDAICFGLFGTFPSLNSRKITLEEVIMRKPLQADFAKVQLWLDYNGSEYFVERTIFSGNKTNQAKLFKKNKLIAGPSVSQVNEVLQSEIEMDYNLFSRAVYSEQNELDSFLRLSPRERKEKFDELLELDKYEIAHVLEHLVFDGTRQFPRRQDLSVAIDEIGAEFDGSTYEEFTSYCLKTGPRNFPRAALLLSEIILRPLLLNSQLEKEKKVIFQELNLREDDPIIKITDSLQETVFPGHPLGCSREKSRLSLRKLKIRDLKEFWQKKYVSKNSVLVICGDLEKQGDLHLLTKDYFDDLTRGKPSVIETVPKEKKQK